GNAAAAQTLSFTAPTSATAGAPFTITLKALDGSGNVATGYRGTVHFTSTDGQASLPPNYTFTANDNGSHTFTSGVMLATAGNQTLTATDTGTSSITGTSGTIAVSAAAAKYFTVSPPTTPTPAMPFHPTLTPF